MNKSIYNNWKLIVTIVLFVANFNICSAQFSMEVTGGWVGGFMKDNSFSPLNYKKSAQSYQLDFAYRWHNNNRAYLGLGGGLGKFETKASEDFTLQYYNIRFDIGYQRLVWNATNSISLWVGGEVRSDIDLVLYKLDGYTYLLAHTFRPTVSGEWCRQNHRLAAHLSLPLFALISRPPYNMMPEYDAYFHHYPYYIIQELNSVKPLFWNNYFDIDISLLYYYSICDVFEIGAGYNFQFKHCKIEKPTTIVDNRISLNLKFNL